MAACRSQVEQSTKQEWIRYTIDAHMILLIKHNCISGSDKCKCYKPLDSGYKSIIHCLTMILTPK